MYLLNTLQHFDGDMVESSPLLTDLFRLVPGNTNALKVLTCRIVLHRCIDGLSYGKLRDVDQRSYEELIQKHDGLEMNMKWLERLYGQTIWDCASRFLHRDPITNRSDTELVEAVKLEAKRGDLDAMYLLGLALLNAYGMDSDRVEGVRVLSEAAGRGNTSAQATLGYLYCLGHMVDQDVEKGLRYLQSAKAQGSEEAAKAVDYMQARTQQQ